MRAFLALALLLPVRIAAQLAFWLTAILIATPQTPPAACTLAGPSVEAHWSGAIPPASTAEAPLSAEVGEGVERLEKAPQRKSLQSLIFTQSGRRDLNPRSPEPHATLGN